MLPEEKNCHSLLNVFHHSSKNVVVCADGDLAQCTILHIMLSYFKSWTCRPFWIPPKTINQIQLQVAISRSV